MFARNDLGAGPALEILSLANGLRRDHTARQKTRQNVADTHSTRTEGGGGLGKDIETDSGVIAGTLQAGAHPGSYCGQYASQGLLIAQTVSSKWWRGTGGPSGDECQNLVAFPAKLSNQTGFGLQVSPTLHSNPMAISFRAAGQDGFTPSQITPPVCASSGGNSGMPVCLDGEYIVRRLTPLECERLQGFPDHWTAGFADSIRYKMLGNAVNVAVSTWLAKKVKAVL